MLVTFTQPAEDGAILAPPGCLDSAIGRRYPLEVAGLPLAEGVITDAAVTRSGQAASLTLDIPDGSPAALAVAAAGGGGAGPFGISEDGTVYRPIAIRRRDPEEAARLIREQYRERGWPAELAEAMIEETLKP
jgi:hypothetical protein